MDFPAGALEDPGRQHGERGAAREGRTKKRQKIAAQISGRTQPLQESLAHSGWREKRRAGGGLDARRPAMGALFQRTQVRDERVDSAAGSALNDFIFITGFGSVFLHASRRG